MHTSYPRYYYSYGHHQDLHSFPTRRSSDLDRRLAQLGPAVDRASDRVDVRRRLRRLHAAPHVNAIGGAINGRSEEHTSELQSLRQLVCRLLLEKKKSHKPPETLIQKHYV